MAFLPLYVPGRKQLKIVIAGGGYAGIAALTALHRYMPGADITLIDPRTDHLKITHLHETFRYPLSDLLVPFSVLERRFGCRHVHGALTIDESMLCQWQRDQCLYVGDLAVPFDYLLIASGAPTMGPGSLDERPVENVFKLDDFFTIAGSELLDRFLVAKSDTSSCISVIGGGATGIQFLFEIADYLRRQRVMHTLRVIDGGDRILSQFPRGFAHYVEARMLELDIEFYPGTRFLGQHTNKLLLEDKNTGRIFELPSILSLVFPGKKQNDLLATNSFGQVIIDRMPLENIFAAGDCATYQSFGSNAMTAQSAVRKGKLAARNILRHSGILKVLEPYLHRDIGYVVSLGPTDAVGWLALENNVVTGMPALVIKEIVEAQYDLLLTGVDTYLI
jgi:NADH dehydrogenase